ncbi:hypothetical protein F4604DRAFT_1686998 [Suillus subluteus]|nr:hypothetical protein F4604DRAFT_1686998 [Suillus subluteus]
MDELGLKDEPMVVVSSRTHLVKTEVVVKPSTQVHSRMPFPLAEERERVMMKRECQREHFELERMERERMEREHLECEYMERERGWGMSMSIAERERMEREHLERMERQQHHDALESLETMECERAEREALKRLPTPQELALLLQSHMECSYINLGLWVPHALPSPWLFGDHMPCIKQGGAQEIGKGGLVVPPEVRLIVLIPSSFLPTSRPHKLELWGG